MLIPNYTIFLKMQENMFGLPVYSIHSYTFTRLDDIMALLNQSRQDP